MTIPEIDLELKHGTLGGRFTTLEGILDQVYEELSDKVFASGDSSSSSSVEDEKTKFENFLSGLKAVRNIFIFTLTNFNHLPQNNNNNNNNHWNRSKMPKDHSRSSSMIHSQILIFRVCMRLTRTLGWR